MRKPTDTVTLTSADEARHFKPGEKVSIGDLPEAEARAIFGDPVYEHWRDMQDSPATAGMVTVTSIDRGAGVITVSQRPTSAKP
jgi:hypothetical protein